MPDNMEDEDEDDSEELSFWDECARVAKKNPAPQRGGAAPLGPSGRAPAAGTTASKKKVNKEEVYVSVRVHAWLCKILERIVQDSQKNRVRFSKESCKILKRIV